MKVNKGTIILLGLIISMILTTTTFACSSFVIQDKTHMAFGYNWDYPVKPFGYFMTNKKDINKNAFLPEEKNTVKWKSKFNSITYNYIGKEFPLAGINEKGLTVSAMALPDSKYPNPDNRPAIESLQWIQYQLDTAASVKEVIESNKKIRISQSTFIPVHYFIADKNGNLAVIEFINGKQICHTGNTLPVAVLANSTYDKSLNLLTRFAMDSDSDNYGLRLVKLFSGYRRFLVGAYLVNEFSNPAKKNLRSVDWYAPMILDGMKLNTTVWQIIFEPKTMKIQYRAAAKTEVNPFVNKYGFKEFRFNDFDFNKQIIIDMNKQEPVNKIFTLEENKEIIQYAKHTFEPDLTYFYPSSTKEQLLQKSDNYFDKMPEYIKNEFENNK